MNSLTLLQKQLTNRELRSFSKFYIGEWHKREVTELLSYFTRWLLVYVFFQYMPYLFYKTSVFEMLTVLHVIILYLVSSWQFHRVCIAYVESCKNASA